MSLGHIKGFVGELLKRHMSYHNEVETFAMSITGQMPEGSSVRAKIGNFIDNISDHYADILIPQTLFKLREYNEENKIDFFKDLVRKTMNLELDDIGNLTQIFPNDTQDIQKTYIETQLQSLSFTSPLHDFRQAFQIFLLSGRGALDLLRSSYENIIKEMVLYLEGINYSNFMDNLIKLEHHNVLIVSTSPRPNKERELSYNLFGLLSEYGSHASGTDIDMNYILFLEVVAWIYLLIKRYNRVI